MIVISSCRYASVEYDYAKIIILGLRMSEIRIFYNGVSISQQTILTSHEVLHSVTSSG
jgi:hypothetical protein